MYNEADALPLLPPGEQLLLHRYFGTIQTDSDADLLEYRRRVTQEEPSLPNRAGKVWARLAKGERTKQHHRRTPQPHPHSIRRSRRKPHNIAVYSLANPNYIEDLARALVKMAMADVDAEAAEARRRGRMPSDQD